MRRISAGVVCILLLMLCCATGACNAKESTIDGFGSRKLFKEKVNTATSPQGAASWGHYLFQFYDQQERVVVFDVDTGKSSTISTERVGQYHCNNVNFGAARYEGSDEFPLLYVSMEHIDQHKALVYRVGRRGEDFTLDVVQTIHYPDPVTAGLYYPNLVLDNDNGYLYLTGYSTNSYEASEDNRLCVARFPLPDPHAGDVTLSVEDMICRIELDSITATQGAVCYDGKIYQVYGFDGYPTLRVIDVDGQCVRDVVYLKEYGFKREPESLTLYDGALLCVDVAGNVYRFDGVLSR